MNANERGMSVSGMMNISPMIWSGSRDTGDAGNGTHIASVLDVASVLELPPVWFLPSKKQLLSERADGRSELMTSFDGVNDALAGAGLPALEKAPGDGGVSLISWTNRSGFLRDMVRLEMTTGVHFKFYELKGPGGGNAGTTARWGRIDTEGQTAEYDAAAFHKKLAEKTKKGYVVVSRQPILSERILFVRIFSPVKHFAVLSMRLAAEDFAATPETAKLHALRAVEFFESLADMPPTPEKAEHIFSVDAGKTFFRSGKEGSPHTVHGAVAGILVGAMERECLDADTEAFVLAASGRFVEAIENVHESLAFMRNDVDAATSATSMYGDASLRDAVNRFAGRLAVEKTAEEYTNGMYGYEPAL